MVSAPEKGSWSKNYSDDSGVEFGIEYDLQEYVIGGEAPGLVKIEHIDSIEWPIDKIDWLIDCLSHVREIANTGEAGSDG